MLNTTSITTAIARLITEPGRAQRGAAGGDHSGRAPSGQETLTCPKTPNWPCSTTPDEAALRTTTMPKPTDRVRVTIELTAQEAQALAQMCKRFRYDDATRLANRHDEGKSATTSATPSASCAVGLGSRGLILGDGLQPSVRRSGGIDVRQGRHTAHAAIGPVGRLSPRPDTR
jgi:hypothetical protein